MITLPTMLITDDDHALRETLGSVFADRGFRTLLAGDGKEALEVVSREEIHIVLIDFHMPRMTGLEALVEIKQHHKRLPVILMSAKLDEEMSDSLYEAEAYSVHSKPINISKIRADIVHAMQTIYDYSMDC